MPLQTKICGLIGYSSKYFVARIKEALEKIVSEAPYRIMEIEQGRIKEDGLALGAALFFSIK